MPLARQVPRDGSLPAGLRAENRFRQPVDAGLEYIHRGLQPTHRSRPAPRSRDTLVPVEKKRPTGVSGLQPTHRSRDTLVPVRGTSPDGSVGPTGTWLRPKPKETLEICHNSNVAVSGKRILVTGACSLIGEAICRQLAADGASVTGLSESKTGLRRLADEIGPGFDGITADIRGSEVILQLARLGRFDALVCHSETVRVDGTTASALPDLMQQQLFCALHAIEGCGPAMREAGTGHVLILECAPGGRFEGVAQPSCQTWKGGYDSLVKRWSAELSESGVRLTVIGLEDFVETSKRISPDPESVRSTLASVVATAVVNTLAEVGPAEAARALVELEVNESRAVLGAGSAKTKI